LILESPNDAGYYRRDKEGSYEFELYAVPIFEKARL
jgi:hypothetical protein